MWREGPDEALGPDLTSPGDLDGDGHADLALSVPRDPITGDDLPGEVYLFPGAILGGHSRADGDGRDDLAIGAPHNVGAGHHADKVYLLADLGS